MAADTSQYIDELVEEIIPVELIGRNPLKKTSYPKRVVQSPASAKVYSPETVRFDYFPQANLLKVGYRESPGHVSKKNGELPRIHFCDVQEGIERLFASKPISLPSVLFEDGTKKLYLLASLDQKILTLRRELKNAGFCIYKGTMQEKPVFAAEQLQDLNPADFPDVKFLALFEANYGLAQREKGYQILAQHFLGVSQGITVEAAK